MRLIRHTLSSLLGGALVLILSNPVVALTGGSPIEDIPLDSWIYQAVFELSTLGHFEGLMLHTRPYTRGEVASAVASLNNNVSTMSLGERVLVARLAAEFHEELSSEGKATNPPSRRARLGIGPTARVDQIDDGFSKNRGGFDASASFTESRHLSARARVRFDSDGRFDSQFHGEYWREHFTAWVDQAVVVVRAGPVDAAFGREFWRWGRSPIDAMLISDHSPPFNGLRVVFHGGNWTYALHATQLDSMRTDEFDTVNRYLAAHRFNWRPWADLELAVSEVIVFGGAARPWAWNYLNPIVPYYWEQLNNGTDDNPLWNLELSWRPAFGLELYGEWMIDDFQIDFSSEPQQIGVLVGVVWWVPTGDGRLVINAEYERINTFVYGQNRPWNRYIHNYDLNGQAIGIGSNLGTDADRITTRPRWHQSALVDLVGLVDYVRHGENRLTDIQESGVPKGVPFPMGTVERCLTIGLGLHVQSGGHIVVDAMAGYETVDNNENIPGTRRSGPFARLMLVSQWWKTFGL